MKKIILIFFLTSISSCGTQIQDYHIIGKWEVSKVEFSEGFLSEKMRGELINSYRMSSYYFDLDETFQFKSKIPWQEQYGTFIINDLNPKEGKLIFLNSSLQGKEWNEKFNIESLNEKKMVWIQYFTDKNVEGNVTFYFDKI